MIRKLIGLLVFLLLGSNLFSQVPIILNYQGRLLDNDGVPLASRKYDMQFRLYNQQTGGTLLWSESHLGTNGVNVKNGFFSTTLGRLTAINPAIFNNPQLWLETEVTISGVAQTFQRVRLTSAPYAVNSARLENLLPDQFLRSDIDETAQGNITFAKKITVQGNTQLGNDSADRALITGVLTAGKTSDPAKGYHIFGDRTSSWSDISDRNDLFISDDLEVYEDQVVGDDLSVADQFLVQGRLRSPALNTTYDLDDPNDDVVSIYDHLQVVSDAAVDDDMIVYDDLYVYGTKFGSVSEIAINAEQETLEQGDVVEIAGYEQPISGNIPVIKIRKSKQANSKAVIGVVDRRLEKVKSVKESGDRIQLKAVKAKEGEKIMIAPGQYGSVVTFGAFARINVDADAGGSIAPGDLLVSSPTPGYAMKSINPAPGTIIAKALSSLGSGKGKIPAVIILH